MKPVEYIPILQDFYKNRYQMEYPIFRPVGDPWTPFHKSLHESRIAVICSGGIFRCGQPAFEFRGHDDFSVREIAKDTSARDLIIYYGFYDQADVEEDIDILLPLHRLQELQDEGFIGGFCPTVYGLGVGRWLDPTTPERLQEEVAEDLAQRCRGQRADAVLLIPG